MYRLHNMTAEEQAQHSLEMAQAAILGVKPEWQRTGLASEPKVIIDKKAMLQFGEAIVRRFESDLPQELVAQPTAIVSPGLPFVSYGADIVVTTAADVKVGYNYADCGTAVNPQAIQNLLLTVGDWTGASYRGIMLECVQGAGGAGDPPRIALGSNTEDPIILLQNTKTGVVMTIAPGNTFSNINVNLTLQSMTIGPQTIKYLGWT